MVSESRAILSETDDNEFLKQLFRRLDDQNEHVYEDCVIYCRKGIDKLTLNFEITN